MVVAYLIYDTRSLLACSLTCYSWYIAAVPHLHHTLIALNCSLYSCEGLRWPKPLRNAHRLGLLPLVRKFQIHRGPLSCEDHEFSTKQFNYRILRQSFGLTNVQDLGLDNLEIPRFIPRIRRYFGHFLPTVRSLALRDPGGSRRQVIYFISLFQHLQDLKLLYNWVEYRKEPVNDLTLIPACVPPLRGRLTMTCFTRVRLLKDMISLFGGIRFRHMDLFHVKGMRLLLDACTDTLESLRLYPTDPLGKWLLLRGVQFMTDDFTAKSSLQYFSLSRHKSLRTLETTASSMNSAWDNSPDTASSLLGHVLSTITSPVFSEVIVFYRDYSFYGVQCRVQAAWLRERDCPPFHRMSQVRRKVEVTRHRQRFEVFHRMHRVRDFQLVLCVDVWDRVGEYSVRALKRAVADEKARGGFSKPFSEPLVVYHPRGSGPDSLESYYGAGHSPSDTTWTPL